MTQLYRLHLAKEDFKFSAAHATVFGPEDVEPLHGHNYRLQFTSEETGVDELGFARRIDRVKAAIRALCAELDEQTLIAERCPYVSIDSTGADGSDLEIQLGARSYRIPREDVRVLPLVNVTMEELARYTWCRLVEELRIEPGTRVEVTIGETSGQSCTFASVVERDG